MGPFQPVPGQIGQGQQRGGRVLGPFFPEPAGNVPQGIRSLVSEPSGVFRAADAKRIHHQDDAAFHFFPSLASNSFNARRTMVWNRFSANR